MPAIRSWCSSSRLGSIGKGEKPQLPVTSVVTPCETLLCARPSSIRLMSECVWMSIRPGVATRPRASTTSRADTASPGATATMRPPARPMSADRGDAPVPSTTRAPLIRQSIGSPLDDATSGRP